MSERTGVVMSTPVHPVVTPLSACSDSRKECNVIAFFNKRKDMVEKLVTLTFFVASSSPITAFASVAYMGFFFYGGHQETPKGHRPKA